MTKLLSICQNTFVQTVRQPIFSVLLAVSFFILVIAVPLTNWAMGTDYHASNQRMLEGLGLSTLLVTSLLAAAFSASGALNREIEDQTALTVISKPVSRITFMAGKLFGVGAAVGLFYYLTAIVYLMTVRHKVMPAAGDPFDWPVIVLGCSSVALAILIALGGNLLFAWTFTSAAVYSATITMSIAMGLITFIGKGWVIVDFGHGLPPQLLAALVLTFMAVVIFVSVAIACSTRLGQVMTLLICCGVFFVGSIHPYIFGYWGDRVILARPLGWLCPVLGYFYAVDAITMDKPIPWSFVGLAGAYCVLFSAGMFAMGAALFETRQLEGQTASASMPAAVMLLAWAGRLASIAAGLIGLELALSVLLAASPLRDLIPAAGLLAASVVGWIFWGLFGRGARWSYRVVLLAGAAGLAAALLAATGLEPVLRTGATGLAAVIIAILLLPQTRRHFGKPVTSK